MEKELINKECKNCIHFLPHFTKDKDRFRPIGGHCVNKKPSKNSRMTYEVCGHFAERDLKEEKEKQIKSATDSLALIAKRINELTQILKILLEKEKA